MRFFGFFIICFSLGSAFSQDKPCPEHTPTSKAKKLYEKGLDKKKYEKKERLLYLKEAINEDPEYLEARLEYATQQSSLTINSSMGIDAQLEHFIKIVETCPSFHSEPYFFLGEHYLIKKDYKKAMEYLRKFVAFESEDESKFSKKYEDYLAEAKEDLVEAEFYAETYVNPVPFNPVVISEIATEADEFLPLISPDNEYLYFTRRKTKEDKKNNGIVVKDQVFNTDKNYIIERFSKSHLLNGKFDAGFPLPSPFNVEDEYNYGGASITIDNKHLFVTICRPQNIKGRNYTNCDIYTSDYIFEYNETTGEDDWHWSNLKNMGPNINAADSWEAQPSISGDGKTLFFASARADTKGGIDIYVTQKDNSGVWQPAINVGEPINTALDDKSPFIHSDSQTLYYASKGNLGFGGYDVFYTRFEKGKWCTPKNIGFPINSSKDEHGFVIGANGKDVFFASDINKEKGKALDIFTFELYKEARPKKVMLVKGIVMDDSGKIPKDATVELKNTATNEISKVQVDAQDGQYAAIITADEDDPVVVNVKSEGKVFSSQLLIAGDDTKAVQTVSTGLQTLSLNKPFKIHDIYYAVNASEINAHSKLILNEFAQYLKENPNMKIAIYGHTDDIGRDAENLTLSTDRAFSVMEYLQSKGIESARLSFKGFGETKPIASNETEEGRSKNRRTEFVILSY